MRELTLTTVPESDWSVLDALRRDDERAFERLFRQHYPALVRTARTYLPDPDEAEEEVQALFVTLWERRQTLAVTTSLTAYLFQSVRNRCLHRLEHRAVREAHRQHVAYRGEDHADAPDEVLIGRELLDRLETAIAALPDACRRVFVLNRYDGLRYGEIADRLGISAKTVENQIGKALRLLRTELADFLPVLISLLTFFFNRP